MSEHEVDRKAHHNIASVSEAVTCADVQLNVYMIYLMSVGFIHKRNINSQRHSKRKEKETQTQGEAMQRKAGQV